MKYKLNIKLAIYALLILVVGIKISLTFFSHKEIDINQIDTSKLQLTTEQIQTYKEKYVKFSDKLKELIKKYENTKNETDKPDQDYFIEKARYAEYLGQHEEAIWTLEQLLKYYNNSSVGWNNLATIYEGMGKYKKAIKYYKKIIDTFSPQAMGKYYMRIAQLYLKLGEKEMAKSNYIEYGKWEIGTDPELDQLIEKE